MNLLRAGSLCGIKLVLVDYCIVSLLAVAVGLQVVQVLHLQLEVLEIGIEPAKGSLTYSKMSVMSFDSDVVLKMVRHISVADL